jgi:hypothetical protein
MQLITGIVLVALAVGSFISSLPRRGRTARFVGTEWEGYVVAGMVGALGLGVVMIIAGSAEFLT